MMADQLRQDVIANNLANATTPGYKGDRAVGKEAFSLKLHEATSGREIGTLGLGAQIDEVATDTSQGALRRTGNELDLAVAGAGYFAVRTQAGVRFTRDGAFTQNAAGEITTARGEQVLGVNGQPIKVPEGSEITVDERGTVLAGERAVGTLQVSALDEASVRKAGDDLFTGRPQATGEKGRVEQGFLEQANVSSVREMVDLISTMRSFESSQRTVKAIDETLGKAVNEVGRV
jgi:flagellar basal-body rod protein FlgG